MINTQVQVNARKYASAAELMAAAAERRKRLFGKPVERKNKPANVNVVEPEPVVEVVVSKPADPLSVNITTHTEWTITFDAMKAGKCYGIFETNAIAVEKQKRSFTLIAIEVLKQHPGITISMLKSGSRVRKVSVAKQHFCYVVRKEREDASFKMIAKFLNLDHTTVIHAIQSHMKRNGL